VFSVFRPCWSSDDIWSIKVYKYDEKPQNGPKVVASTRQFQEIFGVRSDEMIPDMRRNIGLTSREAIAYGRRLEFVNKLQDIFVN